MTHLPTLPLLWLLLIAAAHTLSLVASARAGTLLRVSDQLYLLVPAAAALFSWFAVRTAGQRGVAVRAATCLTLLAAAEIYLVAAYDLRGLRAPDYGLGDALYHAYYLGLLLLLLRGEQLTGARRVRLGPPDWVLDSLITALVVAEISWMVGLAPLLADPGSSLLLKTVNVSYVVLDVILLTLVLLRARMGTRAWPLLLGLLSYVLADLLYLMSGPVRVPVGLTDLLWTWGTVGQAVGFALLTRPASLLSPAARTGVAGALRALPYAAVLTTCLILLIAAPEVNRGAAGFTAAVFGLVMIRQAFTLAETARLNRTLTAQAAELQRSRDEMEFRALHDSLTGLLNRDGFRHLLQASAGPRTLLMLDLDGFKPVNDTHGHAAGDHVLRGVARRIQDVGGVTFDAARLGGDEFALLSRAPLAAPHARAVAARLIERLSEPFEVRGALVTLGVSVGAAQGDGGMSPDALLGRADAAMYRAKREGGARLSESCELRSDGLSPPRPQGRGDL